MNGPAVSCHDEGLDSQDEIPDICEAPGVKPCVYKYGVVEDLTGETTSDTPQSDQPAGRDESAAPFQPRNYQREMLHLSLQKNIIVAMDTGSGKTAIAIMRIMAELESMQSTQIVWFLAPTVTLVEQQHEALKTFLNVPTKMLSGADDIDHWSDQKIWDAVLMNVKVAVSTPQILLDAMSHAFLPLQRLALIVFDEVRKTGFTVNSDIEGLVNALGSQPDITSWPIHISNSIYITIAYSKPIAHNYIGKNAGAQLMRLFYHPAKVSKLVIPAILGLTASPVMKSRVATLERLEETLDAQVAVPKLHRAELRGFVNLPYLLRIYYRSPPRDEQGLTSMLDNLRRAYLSMNIMDDPEFHASTSIANLEDYDCLQNTVSVSSEGSAPILSVEERRKARHDHKILAKDTYCQKQMKSFYSMSQRILQQLGPWCADFYIAEVISKVLDRAQRNDNILNAWADTTDAQKAYLADVLGTVSLERTSCETLTGDPPVSEKVAKLIETILHRGNSISAILFVQERAMVCALCQLLRTHPATKDILRLGTMVGASLSRFRSRNITEFLNIDEQKSTLQCFRSGEINLVVATSVLEEGIDVAACNTVLCFSKPANIKSFIQRRGRARQRHANLILFLEAAEDQETDWLKIEEEMKQIYEDEMRVLQEFLTTEDGEDHDNRQLRVARTGALLTLDNAVSHLYHLTSTLRAGRYVKVAPEFICFDTDDSRIKARVLLPMSVPECLRIFESRDSWLSEKNAIKDAAFEAYSEFFRAGLVNDHLLPHRGCDSATDDAFMTDVETRPSMLEIEEQVNPYVAMAKVWQRSHTCRDIQTVPVNFGASMTINLHLPAQIPRIPRFVLYPLGAEMIVSFQPAIQASANEASRWFSETRSILHSAFGHRFTIKESNFVLACTTCLDRSLHMIGGQQAISAGCESPGLVRDVQTQRVFILKELLDSKPPIADIQFPSRDEDKEDSAQQYVSLRKWPRRVDFYHHPRQHHVASKKAHEVVLPVSRCTMDALPWELTLFAALIPSIMRKLEIYFIADKLSKGILSDVGIANNDLIVAAIIASSANEPRNSIEEGFRGISEPTGCRNANERLDYQRLEFLGDSVLKLCSSVQLIDMYPSWPEAWLSSSKDRLVANSRLARAALAIGLEKYIITKQFTGLEWRPLYVDDLLLRDEVEGKRWVSSKVLADVCEALLGASMIDGGYGKVLKCLRIFLPEIDWQGLAIRRASLFKKCPEAPLPTILQPLERLLGYTFRKKSLLLEAVTHASCTTGYQSFERLEFLGDAILDNIVVTAAHAHPAELCQETLHLLRSALVNADFLAFICMELSTEQATNEIFQHQSGSETKFDAVPARVRLPLWKFMRHHSSEISREQALTAQRHTTLRHKINEALNSGRDYPWTLLATVRYEKFYSDMIESILGAMWVDSGSLDICRHFVQRIGILPFMYRAIKAEVALLHPKEQLGILAGTETVIYRVGRRKGHGDQTEYTCQILVGSKEIVHIGGGVGKLQIQVAAAEKAVEVLQVQEGLLVRS